MSLASVLVLLIVFASIMFLHVLWSTLELLALSCEANVTEHARQSFRQLSRYLRDENCKASGNRLLVSQ